MSIHNWRQHWRAFLLTKDLVPIQPMANLIGLNLKWGIYDDCDFTASVPVSSRDYGYLDPEVDQFLWLQRLTYAQVFAIQHLELAWKMRRGRKERVVNLAGMGGAKYFLSRRVVQPGAAAWVDTITNQPYDDCIIQLMENQGGTGAYADPNSASRRLTQLATAAKKGEAANYGQDMERTPDNLWDMIYSLCVDGGIDLTYTPTWNGPDSAITFTAETHYGGRGADNGVILSDRYGVLTESRWWRDKYDLKTHAYDETGQAVVAASDAADHFRAEMRVKTQDALDLRQALEQNDEKKGHSFGFRETKALQLGVDIWLGDTAKHHDTTFSTDVISELLTGIEIEIQDDGNGSERIQLTLGDLKPNAARDAGNSGSSGGGGGGDRGREVPGALDMGGAGGDVAEHVLTGPRHTESGLTAGHVLRATAPTTFAFGAIQESDLPESSQHTAAFVQASEPSPTWIGQIWVDIS